MRAEAFKELCASIRYAGKVLRGEAKASRVFTVDAVFIKGARNKLKLSQREFADLIRLPVATLQNWEQGRTVPKGPAKALLIVAAKEPQVVYEALHPTAKRPGRRRAS